MNIELLSEQGALASVRMVSPTVRWLGEIRAKRERLDRAIAIELDRELRALPARYGFKNVAGFVRAVAHAFGELRRRKHSGRGSALDNRLDGFVRYRQRPPHVSDVNPLSDRHKQPAGVPAPAVHALDLFAGAGGFSLAARNLGVRVVAAVENNRAACETYRRNFITRQLNPPKLYEEDLTALRPEDVQRECFTAGVKCEVIMGGPPCQGFSVHRIKDAGVDDPRNGLLLSYFGFVRALAPKVFVLENVPGMLWPRHQEYVKNFYALAKESGYDVKPPVVLNARDFGVPQNRKRVFVLGVKLGLQHSIVWPPAATYFDPESPEVTENSRPAWRFAKEVFKKGLGRKDLNRAYMRSCEDLVAVFRSTPKNGGSRGQSERKLKCHKDHDGHSDVYGRIDPNKPGPTMTTACINPSKGRFVHPWLNHGISARHAARFQGFPENFVFTGGLMAAGVQIGNAVPIPLGEAVLRVVLDGIAAPVAASQAA